MKQLILDGITYNLVPVKKQEPQTPEYPKILEFKFQEDGKIVNLNGDGTYGITKRSTLELMLHHVICFDSGEILIWKVAKNNHEFFTVGDKTNKGTILEFEYDHGDINIYTDRENWLCTFEGLEHEKEPERNKPILITHDGVKIFDKEVTVYGVTPNGLWGQTEVLTRIPFVQNSCWLWFSTKEARESYIFMNKPVFSRNDMNTYSKPDKKKPF